MSDSERLAFVGVGAMGRGMAAHAVRAGRPVVLLAHRSSPDLSGAEVVTDLRDVVAFRPAAVVVSLPGPPEVEAVVAGGLLGALEAGA